MQYIPYPELLGQDTTDGFNFGEAVASGSHQAVADITRIVIIAGVGLAIYFLLPKGTVRKIKREARKVLSL